MNFYALQLHKFILGETRVDGWKSGWRIEQERRRAEEMGKRVFVKAAPASPKIEVKRERQPRGPQKPRARRTERPSKWGIPGGLSPAEYRRLAREQWTKAGLCGACGQPAFEGRYSCASCLERKARYYCKRVKKEYVPKTIVPRFCMECKTLLSAHNVYGFCAKHYKEKRHYLKVAA